MDAARPTQSHPSFLLISVQDHVTPASFVTAGVLWDTEKQILTTLHELKMSCDAGMSDMVGGKEQGLFQG
jgi:hypothetical protein